MYRHTASPSSWLGSHLGRQGPDHTDDGCDLRAGEKRNLLKHSTGELGYDGPLYDGFMHMTDDMLGPSPMHIKYSSYVYDGFCI